jgi:gingipain R
MMFRKILCGLAMAAVLSVFVTLRASAEATWIAIDGSSPPGQPTATIISSDETATVIEFTIPGFYTEDITEGAETYQQLSFPGHYTTLEVGKPQLPAITELVAVPGLANVSVVVSGYTETTLSGYNVYPFQTPLLEDDSPVAFDYDNTTYTTGAYYPGISAENSLPGIWRDIRVVRLRVYPIKHNPVTDDLNAYSTITVTLQYSGTDGPNPLAGSDNPISESHDQMYQSSILNYENVSYAPGGKDGTSQACDGDYDFLIIAADNYVDNMTPFINWKNSTGLSTQIVNLTTTGNTVTSIKNYISQEYTNNNISYVLFIGNESQIPGYTGYGHFSDYYYSLLAGSDDYPDIALGRFCVFSDADVDNMVAKSVMYEQNPPAGDWLEKSLLVANYELAPGKYQECKEQIRTAYETASGSYSVLYPDFTTAYGASFANGGDEATNADVIAYIDAGQRVVNYRGHGSGNIWWNWNIFGEHFGETQVNALNNGDKTPVVFSIACNNNQLDQAAPCLGELFTLSDDGAAAFLGASRASYTIPNHTYDKQLYSAVYDEGINAVGNASNVAAIRTIDIHSSLGLYNARIYLWLGDPSLNVIYSPSGPQVINIPGDQPTIQAGINAASSGDEVVVAPGTYTGTGNINVTFDGKDITVRSSGGAGVTTIQALN